MDNYVSYSDATELMTAIANKINNSGFITNTVNNLVNYYLKTETYSKTEVDALLQAIATLDIQAVSQLPTTNISTTTIYLVPKQDPQVPDVKDEYINLDGTTSGWELIGNTQIDLSNYVTTSDLTTALQSYATKAYVDDLTFVGTQAQWNALTTAQKKAYKYADFTDDYSDNPVGNLSILTTTDKSSCVGAINEVNLKAGTRVYIINNATDINDFIKKLITQVDAELASKQPYMLSNIFVNWANTSIFYGTIERQENHAYAFSLSRAQGDYIYQGYCSLTADSLELYQFITSNKAYSLVSLDSTYDASTDWNIVKQGNICVMNMRNLKDIPAGNTVIGTIPVGFRPEWEFFEYVYSANSNTHLGFKIVNNGEITIMNPTGATLSGTVYVNRNVTYFTA
jgi:hypothetical protein